MIVALTIFYPSFQIALRAFSPQHLSSKLPIVQSVIQKEIKGWAATTTPIIVYEALKKITFKWVGFNYHELHALLLHILFYSTFSFILHSLYSRCSFILHALLLNMLFYSTCSFILDVLLFYMLFYSTLPFALHALLFYVLFYSTFSFILDFLLFYIFFYSTFSFILHALLFYFPFYCTCSFIPHFL